MAERIRVSGFRRPVVRPERRADNRPVALVRPANLVGLLGAAGLFVAVLVSGTPHLLLATRSYGSGASLFYDDCAYAALSGRMVHLRGYSCPLVRLLHEGP